VTDERTLTLYHLPPSPNSVKARIALNYKQLPFESVPIGLDDQERAVLVEVSGQPLSPVLKHGETVVYDSRAILRYLECNFRDTPRIFSPDHDTMQEIEGLENWARTELSEPVGTIFAQARAEDPDLETCRQASEQLTERAGAIEERLEDAPFLMGDSLTTADITAAPVVGMAMVTEEQVQAMGNHPLARFFFENFRLGEGRDRTRDWAGRVLAYAR